MNRVLVAGAAGFIGAHLCNRLLQDGDEVVGLDNLSAPDSRGRLPKIEGKRFSFVESDIRDQRRVAEAAEGVTHIVHVAESKIPRYGKSVETLDVNVHGTEVLLDAAARNQARFIFGSTDEVYGKSTASPLNEESALIIGQPQVARWSFAVSKMLAEHLCFAYSEKDGVRMTILRYSGTYGPLQSLDWRGGPQSVFITAALNRQPIPVHGDGLQVRTLTHVSDIVSGTVAAMNSPHTEGEILNIASSDSISIINLAYLIRRLVNERKKQNLEFIPYTDFSRHYEESRSRVLDISKAFYLIGYEPRVALAGGLEETIALASASLQRGE